MRKLHAALEILRRDPWELLEPLVIFAVILLIGLVLRGLLLRALEAWTRRTGSRPGEILSHSLRGPMLIWAVIVAVHLAIEGSSLPAPYSSYTAKTLLVLWIVSLTLMSARLVGNLVRHYGDQVPGAMPVATLTQTLAELAVVLLGIAVILTSLNFQITPILTALGVGGLAVALALQDTLSNLFSGFYIAVAGQIRLGDYIRLNSGEEGYVSDIGWRSTAVRSLNNNLILIPNAKLAQAIVTNYYLPEKRMSSSVQVSVDHNCDTDQVERVLLEVARDGLGQIPGMAKEQAPSVAFDPGFGDSSLGFTLNYQVEEFVAQFSVRTELRKRILRRFRAEGIAIPYPARSVYLNPPAGPASLQPDGGGENQTRRS